MKISKIYIIGFPKCGSTSLRTYLRNTYPRQCVQSFPGVSLYHPMWTSRLLAECQKEEVLPVIIIRNPVDHVWSSYWWSFRWEGHDVSFEDFLKRRESTDDDYLTANAFTDVTSGLHDPIGCTRYWKYIEKAKDCKPLVMKFEDMIKIPTFPHEAKTDGIINHVGKKLVKPKLDQKHRDMIVNAMKERGLDPDDY